MTAREIGVVVLKMLGVWYCLLAAGDLVEMATHLWLPETLPFGDLLTRFRAIRPGLQLVVDLAIAILLLQHSDRIARFLFGGETGRLELGIEPRQLLFVGLCLVGAWIAVSELGLVLNRAIEVFWYAGGERRPHYDGQLAESALSGLKSLVFVAIGAVLYRVASRRLGRGSPLGESRPTSRGA